MPNGGFPALSSDGVVFKEVRMQASSLPAEQLLSLAQENLRCVDFDKLSLELMMIASGSQETYNLSRPVREGESIDYCEWGERRSKDAPP